MTKVERKPLSKKQRFTVFKRDCFTCQYCGGTPPSVVLEVDHIKPVASGGDNRSDNLLTACFSCNRGKGKEELSVVPETIERRAEILREKEEQVKAYSKLLKAIDKRERAVVATVEAVFCRYFPGREFTETFRDSIRLNFVAALPEDQLISAITRACMKKAGESSAATKYFCGICWNVIKGNSAYGSR